ncbi:MAG: branched-chain amino acid ABC transporter permease [Granulosicoccus sp.]
MSKVAPSTERTVLSYVPGLLFLAALAIAPLLMLYLGKPFWLDVFTRLVILAIAATSLNLLLGVAGLASLGHAAYIAIGAYAVGIPAYHETYGGLDWLSSYNGWVHLLLGLGVCALFALITGAISLRAKGVHFIMITMAFSQMVYYALVSLEEYGGDDGLSVDLQSEFQWLALDNPTALFMLCYVSLLVVLYGMHRLKNSQFGKVLQAARQNETRVSSLGIDPYRYQLLAFVIAGVIAGYAGFLMANFSLFISPSIVEWSRSGELMFMIILGGLSTLVGPALGAAAFVLLEYSLSRITIYWHLPFGLLLLFIVLFGRGGLIGILRGNKSE